MAAYYRCPASCSRNELAYRTKAGGIEIPAGEKFTTSIIDTKNYQAIRVLFGVRTGSTSDVTFYLTLVEKHKELIGYLEPPITLMPHNQYTKVFEVPGTELIITAEVENTGSAGIDIFVYGFKTLCS